MTFSPRSFSLLVFLTGSLALSAQNSFQKIYGEPTAYFNNAAYILPAADSGYLVAGAARAPGFLAAVEPYFLRLDDDGSVLWHKIYPTETDAFFRVVIPANGGGYLGVGLLLSATGGGGSESILVIKTDADGNFLWSKNHNVNTGNIWPSQVRAVSDGYLICGHKWNDTPGMAYLMKINNNGDLVWNRHYDQPGYSWEIRDFLLEGDTVYAITEGFFLSFPLDGGPVQAASAYVDTANAIQTLHKIMPAGDGNFLVLGNATYAIPAFPNIDFNAVSLRKIRKDGALLWSKMLWLPNYRLSLVGLEAAPDGGFVLNGGLSPGGNENHAVLVKINADAEIESAFQYADNPRAGFIKTQVAADGSTVSVGNISVSTPGLTSRHAHVVKTLPDGRVEGCCAAPLAVQVRDYPSATMPLSIVQIDDFNEYITTFSLVAALHPYSDTNFCSYIPAVLHDTLRFCPGESLTLNDVTYTQPATVTDTIISPFGCDTIRVHALEFFPLPQPSNISIQCPAGFMATAPQGAASVAAPYPAPTSASDCPCGDVLSNLVQGFPSGSNFPLGVTQVCYEVADDCGSAASCCFTVTVEAEPADEEPCDVKTTACVKFEILGIFQNPAGQKTYRLRVTNFCANKLIYTAFQLPDGVTADQPANGTIYATPGGRQYDVRNANASPFHSIRFKAQGDGIAGGQSDVFEYALPPQAAPVFIHATARLEPQIFYETHLNVFDCVVQPTAARAGERGAATETARPLAVFPNPVTTILQVDLSAWAGEPARLQVLDAIGRLQIDQTVAGETSAVPVDFSALPGGIYALVVTSQNGERKTVRVVRM